MDSMERTFQLHVPSSTENLAMIRDFVGSIGERAGMSPGDVGKLKVAVDEACANVIEHAYGSDDNCEVTVKATLDPEQVLIEIVDTGRGFDPSTIEQVNLDQLAASRKSGGLGMRLIRSVMDEVQYQIGPAQKNELRMVKRLKKKEPSPKS
ncbi:MAG TPA: ATP-binding protein [Bryobacteraceae bacterium]|jgi:serine/threonine-protein kinase RsbW|nr:ATP-binding protein [Bryobacteraceae bacterium]